MGNSEHEKKANLWLKTYYVCCKSQVRKAKIELGRGHGGRKVPLESPQPLSIYCHQGVKILSPIWVTSCTRWTTTFSPLFIC